MYSYTTSKSLAGTIEATVPAGKDPGQTVLLSGALNGNDISLVLTTTNGYVVTTSGVVSTFSMQQDATETVTLSFDFKSSGAFTIE